MRRLVNPIVMAASAFVGMVAGLYAYREWQSERPAAGNLRYGRHKGQRVVVCAGDSLTHGRVSADYVAMLRKRFGHETAFVNAGVNGDLTYNLLQRLDDIIVLQPDVVTIMIGTNDANAMLNEDKARDYVKGKDLPLWPSFHWYERNLREIVARLKAETQARIALLSPPVYGDEVESPLWKHIEEYIDVTLRVAFDEEVTYLPLYEAQINFLKKQDERRAAQPNADFPVSKATTKRYLLGESWDDISAGEGYHLLTDRLHLNRRGAMMVANLIEEFIRQERDGDGAVRVPRVI